jgi:hypothetical protein
VQVASIVTVPVLQHRHLYRSVRAEHCPWFLPREIGRKSSIARE